MLTYVIAVVAGILAGLLGALLGVGGGVVMLPATQFLMNFPPTLSIGTTLFAVIFTSASGAFGHFRAGNVLARASLLIGAGGLMGVGLGSHIFKQYLSRSTALLELLLGILFLYMAVRMAGEVWRMAQAEAEKPAGKTVEARPNQSLPVVQLLLLGLITGLLSGIMGLGGGFIMVPGIMWIMSVTPYQAVGSTLLAMFPIALLGGSIKLQQGFVNLPVGLLLGMGTIVGAQLGVKISPRVKPLLFKSVFALLFLYLFLNYTWSALHSLI